MHKYLIAVGICIIFDVITGLLKAGHEGKIDSSKIRSGLYHKLSEIIAVAGSAIFTHYINQVEMNISFPLVTCVGVYICTMEIISIVENLCAVNPKLKRLFVPYLKKLKGDENDEKRN